MSKRHPLNCYKCGRWIGKDGYPDVIYDDYYGGYEEGYSECGPCGRAAGYPDKRLKQPNRRKGKKMAKRKLPDMSRFIPVPNSTCVTLPAQAIPAECEELLKKAATFLVNISAWAGACHPEALTGNLSLLEQDSLALATRIERYLKGKED